jgi:long-subunit fatty acid transport protein
MRRFSATTSVVLGFALALVVGAAPARADVSDLLGMDARTRGMGMATLTLCEDYTAAACNPAAGAMASGISVGLGYSFSKANLTINGSPSEVLDIRGVPLGFNAPFSLGKSVRAAVSLMAYLPDQFLARVQLVPAYEPRFVLLDNRPHRVVVNMSLSLRPWKWLSVGLGATLLADAAGNGITFNVGVKGGKKVGETAIDLVLPIKLAPLVGLLVKPLPWLRFGAFYRGAIDLGVALDIVANVDVAGIVTGDAIITLRAVNYYTPHRLEVGMSVDPHPRFTLAAGVALEMWSLYSGGVPDVRILVDLGLNPPMAQAFWPPDNFQNVISPRLGAEYRHDFAKGRYRLAARAGYVYAPTPVPAQVGLPSLVDNNRHVLAAGLGFRVARVAGWYPYPVSLDLGFQYHVLAERSTVRNLLSDPMAGGLRSAGSLISLAASVKLEY